MATVMIGQNNKEEYVPHQKLQPSVNTKKMPIKSQYPMQTGIKPDNSKVVVGRRAPQNYWNFESVSLPIRSHTRDGSKIYYPKANA